MRAQWLCCAQLHNLPAERENAVLDVIRVVEDDEARLLVVGGLGGDRLATRAVFACGALEVVHDDAGDGKDGRGPAELVLDASSSAFQFAMYPPPRPKRMT